MKKNGVRFISLLLAMIIGFSSITLGKGTEILEKQEILEEVNKDLQERNEDLEDGEKKNGTPDTNDENDAEKPVDYNDEDNELVEKKENQENEENKDNILVENDEEIEDILFVETRNLLIPQIRQEENRSRIDNQKNKTAKYLFEKFNNDNSNKYGTEWVILGLGRSDYSVPEEYFNNYYKKVEKKIIEEHEKESSRWNNRVTDVERVALALASIGRNPENIKGINLLDYIWNKNKNFEGITPNGDLGGAQGINEVIFGLLAVDTHNFEEPEDVQTSRERMIEKILDEENGKLSNEVDLMVMAIQALAPYKDREDISESIDRMLEKISGMQKEDGKIEITFWGKTSKPSETLSQVIVALTSLGIDPHTDPRFVKNDISIVDALLDFTTDEGGFKHLMDYPATNQMATEQAFYAIVSLDRLYSDENSLYNMRDTEFIIDKIDEIKFSILGDTVGIFNILNNITVDKMISGNTFEDLIDYISTGGYYKFEKEGSEKETSFLSISFGDDVIKKGDFGNDSGWMFKLNDQSYKKTFDLNYMLEDGDNFTLAYTTDNGIDLEKTLGVYLHDVVKSSIDQINNNIYTTDSLNDFPKELEELNEAILENSDYFYSESGIYDVKNILKDLFEVKNGLVKDEFKYTINKEVEAGDEVTLVLDNIPIPTVYRNSKKEKYPVYVFDLHSSFETNIPGLSEIKSKEISRHNRLDIFDEIEDIKIIKFTIPEDTVSGTYTLSNGGVKGIWGGGVHPQNPIIGSKNYHLLKDILPEIQIKVSGVEPELSTATLSVEKRSIGKGDVLSPTTIEFTEDNSVWDVFEKEMTYRDIPFEYNTSWGSPYL